jgi:ATP adenylyltransferase
MQDPHLRTPASHRFDWIVDGHATGPRYPFDVDLFGFEDVAVTPTIGALVPGWTLLVPRVRAFCFAELLPKILLRVQIVTGLVRERMHAFGGRQYLFEHGSRSCGSDIGCGVDQAHAHLVCLTDNLVERTLASKGGLIWCATDPTSGWSTIEQDREYYYLTDFDRAYVAYPVRSESQYFRRLVAEGLGSSNSWDYRTHKNERNAGQTISVLADRRRSAA